MVFDNSMTNPRISVAMCTYNGEEFLQEQLESIMNQSCQPCELVICDDISTDNTIDIINKFSIEALFPVRLIINKYNMGSTKNFEQAIRLCKGDIIALSDQDDVWCHDKLLRFSETFSTFPDIGGVFTDAEIVDAGLKPMGFCMWDIICFNRHQQKMLKRGNAVDVLLKHNVVTGATMAFRSNLIDLLLPISDKWIHDAWISLLIAFCSQFAIIDKPLIKYRQHQNNQVGLHKIKRNLFDQIKQAKDTTPDSYYKDASYYIPVYQRLSVCSNIKSLEKLSCKVNHLRFRASLPKRKYKHIPLVIRELLAFKYHRFSNGYRSFAKDLFL